ncbi:MAG: hypothetical protein WBG28_13285 [Desulfobulbales bacterium]
MPFSDCRLFLAVDVITLVIPWMVEPMHGTPVLQEKTYQGVKDENG